MELKFKKLSKDAVIPQKATPFDAGFDITTISSTVSVGKSKMITYNTGLSVEIPEGYFGLLVPRSSVYKYDLSLSNCCGILDAKYRGEILFKYRVTTDTPPDIYHSGDRIGQLVIVPLPEFESVEVDELDMVNDRGGGFGHTGT